MNAFDVPFRSAVIPPGAAQDKAAPPAGKRFVQNWRAGGWKVTVITEPRWMDRVCSLCGEPGACVKVSMRREHEEGTAMSARLCTGCTPARKTLPGVAVMHVMRSQDEEQS